MKLRIAPLSWALPISAAYWLFKKDDFIVFLFILALYCIDYYFIKEPE